MKRVSSSIVTTSAFIFMLFACFFYCKTVVAKPDFATAAQGLEISPTLVELNAVRGNTYTLNINVRNITATDLLYSSRISDFTAADESGSPLITDDVNLPNTISVKKWVENIADFELKSRQQKTITAQIMVPDNVEPGGHYGVIRFTGVASNQSSQDVSVSASAGVLLLIKVDGNIIEKASLASFYSAKNDKQSSFFETGPIEFVARIKNDGNVHLKPKGTIVLQNMFGGVIGTIEVNNDKSNILPSSIRKYIVQYNKKWMFGKYTANLALALGTTGQAIIGSTSFWVIPYSLIAICLLAIITFFYIFIRLIKVYNKHIIEKSKNEKTIKNKKNFKQ